MKLILPIILVAGSILAIPSLAQDTTEDRLAQARANEQRVRDSLRTTTQQLRTVEAERVSLLAAQAERDQKISDLEARLAAATEQSTRDKQNAEKTITALTAAGQRKDEEVIRLNTTLTRWKASHAQASALLKQAETTKSQLQTANISLEQIVAERERQNLELYRTASEILQRYADFSFGKALAAREPFTGIARARLEEQVQQYADRLQNTKLKPVHSDPTTTTPTPATATKPKP